MGEAEAVSDASHSLAQGSSEQAASVSEVMDAQAGQMKQMVNEMISIVGGNGANDGHAHTVAALQRRPLEEFSGSQKKKSLTRNVVSKLGEIRPEQIIPFDDYDDF